MLLQYSLGCRYFFKLSNSSCTHWIRFVWTCPKDTQSHGPFHNGKLSGRISYGPPVTMQFIFDLLDFSVKSPCLHPVFGPAFTQYSVVFTEILLNLSLKRWNSGFNAQGSRLIIVDVQVRAVKIYVASVEALREKERQDETQFTIKIGGKTSLGPNYFTL